MSEISFIVANKVVNVINNVLATRRKCSDLSSFNLKIGSYFDIFIHFLMYSRLKFTEIEK